MKNKFGSFKYVIVFLFFTLFFQIIMSSVLKDMNMVEFVKLQLTFDKSDFLKTVNSWSDIEFKEYKAHFLYDFLYLLSYSMLMFSVVLFLYEKTKRYSRYFLFFPFVIAVSDIIENLFHIYFFESKYKICGIWFFLSGSFSLLKWVLIFVEVFYILFLFFLYFKTPSEDS